MSSIFNPFHPAILLLQKGNALQFLATTTITLPPGGTVTFQVIPPPNRLWILLINTWGIPRDAATGNPIRSALLFATMVHSAMVRTYNALGVESVYNYPWPVEINASALPGPFEPLTITVNNGTALTVIWDVTFLVIEFLLAFQVEYDRLWRGIYNLFYLLGGLEQTEIHQVLWHVKHEVEGEPTVDPDPVYST